VSNFLEEGEGVNRLEQRQYRANLISEEPSGYDDYGRSGSFVEEDDARARRPDAQYPNEQYQYAHEDPAFWNAPTSRPNHDAKTDTNFRTNPVYDRFGVDEVDSRYVDHEKEEFKSRFWEDTGDPRGYAHFGTGDDPMLQASDESELADPTPLLEKPGDDPLDDKKLGGKGIENYVRELLEPTTTAGIAAKKTADSRRAAMKKATPPKKAAAPMRPTRVAKAAPPLIWDSPTRARMESPLGRKAAPAKPKKKGFWSRLFGR
jgi:hypothetical protein